MQALLHDLAAEQPGEEAHATEKDADAQIEDLKDIGEYARVFRQAAIPAHGTGESVNSKHGGWREGQQVDPDGPPHPQILLDLDAQDRCKLRGPELPGSFNKGFADARHG